MQKTETSVFPFTHILSKEVEGPHHFSTGASGKTLNLKARIKHHLLKQQGLRVLHLDVQFIEKQRITWTDQIIEELLSSSNPEEHAKFGSYLSAPLHR